MPQPTRTKLAVQTFAVTLAFGLAARAQTPAAAPAYPAMAPIAQYRIASTAEEVARARCAAPASIANDAEVLILGAKGYETAAAGKNGFVCLVQRAWASGLTDAEFWNPKSRSPICFNAAAARSVLPDYLERTRWVLAGATKAEIEARTRAIVTAGKFARPTTGAMAIMMSQHGYLNDDAGGPWHPHVMLFLPSDAGGAAALGADLPGAPVMSGAPDLEPVTTFFIPVRRWSDGTPDPVAPLAPMPMGPANAK